MERLPDEVLKNAIDVYKTTVEACKGLEEEDYCPALDNVTIRFLEELKAYRDAEKHGLLLRLPCNVGDKVYKIWSCGRHGKSIAEFEVAHIDVDSLPEIEFSFFNSKSQPSSYWFAKKTDIGKTVFLTKEETEVALAKMKGEEHE